MLIQNPMKRVYFAVIFVLVLSGFQTQNRVFADENTSKDAETITREGNRETINTGIIEENSVDKKVDVTAAQNQHEDKPNQVDNRDSSLTQNDASVVEDFRDNGDTPYTENRGTATMGSNDEFNKNNNVGLTPAGQKQQGAQPNEFVVQVPDGPGIHAGFQAIGPNYATSISGGVKSPDRASLDVGLNFAGRIGNPQQSHSNRQQQQQQQQPNEYHSNNNQHDGNTRQPSNSVPRTSSRQSSGRYSDTRNQGTSTPLQDEGATFAVSYKPGLLDAIGNMLNPLPMFQQWGDAFRGALDGFGQAQQYSSTQAARPNNNFNGVGIKWKPLYRVFTS